MTPRECACVPEIVARQPVRVGETAWLRPLPMRGEVSSSVATRRHGWPPVQVLGHAACYRRLSRDDERRMRRPLARAG
jgi:hypothetical protein